MQYHYTKDEIVDSHTQKGHILILLATLGTDYDKTSQTRFYRIKRSFTYSIKKRLTQP